MKKLLFFVVFLSLIVSCAKEETPPETPVEPASDWKVYTSANSTLAPYYAINTLFHDRSGILWVNSNNLVRFDGTNWSYFDNSNTGILITGITDGVKSINGINWFGSGAGLIKLENGNWSLFNTSNSSLPTSGINGVAVDQDNNTWLATDQGIVKYDGINWLIYNTNNSPITCNYTKFMRATSSGTIWAGIVLQTSICPSATTGCLARLQNGSWTIFTPLNSNLPDGNIQAMELDRNENLWVAVGAKVSKFNGSNFDVYDSSNSILPANTSLVDLAFDNQNSLWLASPLHGLFKFDGATWKNFTTQNCPLPENFLTSVSIDNNNTKWVGCLTSKVVSYSGN